MRPTLVSIDVASASPGNGLEMQLLSLCCRPTEPETPGRGTAVCVLTSPVNDSEDH